MQVAATTTMAKMLAKEVKKWGYKVRYITCNAEQYSRYVGSIYEAEDYGDWNCNTNKFRAIEVVYPDEYYAMPRYITTKEIVYLRADTQPKNADKCEIIKAYATMEDFMRDQVNSSLSDGECLDIAIELFDNGISMVECSNEEE